MAGWDDSSWDSYRNPLGSNPVDTFAESLSKKIGLDPYYTKLILERESGGLDPIGQIGARSSAGAQGPAQVMPATAQEMAKKYGIDVSGPSGQTEAGLRYYKEQLDAFGGDAAKAAAAYHSGPARVRSILGRGGDLSKELGPVGRDYYSWFQKKIAERPTAAQEFQASEGVAPPPATTSTAPVALQAPPETPLWKNALLGVADVAEKTFELPGIKQFNEAAGFQKGLLEKHVLSKVGGYDPESSVGGEIVKGGMEQLQGAPGPVRALGGAALGVGGALADIATDPLVWEMAAASAALGTAAAPGAGTAVGGALGFAAGILKNAPRLAKGLATGLRVADLGFKTGMAAGFLTETPRGLAGIVEDPGSAESWAQLGGGSVSGYFLAHPFLKKQAPLESRVKISMGDALEPLDMGATVQLLANPGMGTLAKIYDQVVSSRWEILRQKGLAPDVDLPEMHLAFGLSARAQAEVGAKGRRIAVDLGHLIADASALGDKSPTERSIFLSKGLSEIANHELTHLLKENGLEHGLPEEFRREAAELTKRYKGEIVSKPLEWADYVAQREELLKKYNLTSETAKDAYGYAYDLVSKTFGDGDLAGILAKMAKHSDAMGFIERFKADPVAAGRELNLKEVENLYQNLVNELGGLTSIFPQSYMEQISQGLVREPGEITARQGGAPLGMAGKPLLPGELEQMLGKRGLNPPPGVGPTMLAEGEKKKPGSLKGRRGFSVQAGPLAKVRSMAEHPEYAADVPKGELVGESIPTQREARLEGQRMKGAAAKDLTPLVKEERPEAFEQSKFELEKNRLLNQIAKQRKQASGEEDQKSSFGALAPEEQSRIVEELYKEKKITDLEYNAALERIERGWEKPAYAVRPEPSERSLPKPPSGEVSLDLPFRGEVGEIPDLQQEPKASLGKYFKAKSYEGSAPAEVKKLDKGASKVLGAQRAPALRTQKGLVRAKSEAKVGAMPEPSLPLDFSERVLLQALGKVRKINLSPEDRARLREELNNSFRTPFDLEKMIAREAGEPIPTEKASPTQRGGARSRIGDAVAEAIAELRAQGKDVSRFLASGERGRPKGVKTKWGEPEEREAKFHGLPKEIYRLLKEGRLERPTQRDEEAIARAYEPESLAPPELIQKLMKASGEEKFLESVKKIGAPKGFKKTGFGEVRQVERKKTLSAEELMARGPQEKGEPILPEMTTAERGPRGTTADEALAQKRQRPTPRKFIKAAKQIGVEKVERPQTAYAADLIKKMKASGEDDPKNRSLSNRANADPDRVSQEWKSYVDRVLEKFPSDLREAFRDLSNSRTGFPKEMSDEVYNRLADKYQEKFFEAEYRAVTEGVYEGQFDGHLKKVGIISGVKLLSPEEREAFEKARIVEEKGYPDLDIAEVESQSSRLKELGDGDARRLVSEPREMSQEQWERAKFRVEKLLDSLDRPSPTEEALAMDLPKKKMHASGEEEAWTTPEKLEKAVKEITYLREATKAYKKLEDETWEKHGELPERAITTAAQAVERIVDRTRRVLDSTFGDNPRFKVYRDLLDSAEKSIREYPSMANFTLKELGQDLSGLRDYLDFTVRDRFTRPGQKKLMQASGEDPKKPFGDAAQEILDKYTKRIERLKAELHRPKSFTNLLEQNMLRREQDLKAENTRLKKMLEPPPALVKPTKSVTPETSTEIRGQTVEDLPQRARREKPAPEEVSVEETPSARFPLGSKVEHQEFGPGTVESTYAGKVKVKFEDPSVGTKLLAEEFVRVRKSPMKASGEEAWIEAQRKHAEARGEFFPGHRGYTPPGEAPVKEGFIRIYRGEAKKFSGKSGDFSHQGRWFTDSTKGANRYADIGGTVKSIDIPVELAEQIREDRRGMGQGDIYVLPKEKLAEVQVLRSGIKKSMLASGEAERIAADLRPEMIRMTRGKLRGMMAKNNVFAGKTFDELVGKIHELPPELRAEVEKLRSLGATAKEVDVVKGYDPLWEKLGAPRAVITSLDLSGILRQGVIGTARMAISHPLKLGKAIRESISALKDEKVFKESMKTIEDSPGYEFLKALGVDFARSEEQFGGARFVDGVFQKVTGGKFNFVRGSERAYTYYLNRLRYELGKHHIDSLNKLGFTDYEFKVNEKGQAILSGKDMEAYRRAASWVNIATGRGQLPQGKDALSTAFRSADKFLNFVLFSPRLMLARIATLNPGTYIGAFREMQKSKGAVKAGKALLSMHIGDLAAYAGLVGGVMGTLQAMFPDAQIEDDMTSSDFGQVRMGNTRVDVTGGLRTYITAVARILSGETTTEYGVVKPQDQKQTIWNFIRGKFGPLPALAMTLAEGKNLIGESAYGPLPEVLTGDQPITPEVLKEILKTTGGTIGAQTVIPMILSDMHKLVTENDFDPIQLAALMGGSVLGVGVSTRTAPSGITPKIQEALRAAQVEPMASPARITTPFRDALGSQMELQLPYMVRRHLQENSDKDWYGILDSVVSQNSFQALPPAAQRIVILSVLTDARQLRSPQAIREWGVDKVQAAAQENFAPKNLSRLSPPPFGFPRRKRATDLGDWFSDE